MPAVFRIGEVARRTGVSAELLRAWERRYGVPRPPRAAGGFRLYSEQDIEAVASMRGLLEQGVAAAEAARAVNGRLHTDRRDEALMPEELRSELLAAITDLDEPAVQTILDRLLSAVTLETALRDAVLPLLHEIGERWARGELTVAHEHFASNVLRGRLLALGRGWAQGFGPRALLASPGEEQHDLALIAFGIALNRLGWRIFFLGAAVPVDTIALVAERVKPERIVLALTTGSLDAPTAEIAALARRWRVALAGSAATAELADAAGAKLLTDDPVTAAAVLAAAPRTD